MNQTAATQPIQTLEDIALRKAQLKADIDKQQAVLVNTTRRLFAPVEEATGFAQSLLGKLNTGMAIFDGVMLGMKLIKRFRRLFS